VPLAPGLQYVAQQIGAVGHDAIDAEVEQAVHFICIVDRPDVDRNASTVAMLDEAPFDDRQPS